MCILYVLFYVRYPFLPPDIFVLVTKTFPSQDLMFSKKLILLAATWPSLQRPLSNRPDGLSLITKTHMMEAEN